jgi:hypothetical protein
MVNTVGAIVPTAPPNSLGSFVIASIHIESKDNRQRHSTSVHGILVAAAKK